MSSAAQNGAPRHSTSDLEQANGPPQGDPSIHEGSYRTVPSSSANPTEHDASYRTLPSTAGDTSSMASDRYGLRSCSIALKQCLSLPASLQHTHTMHE